MSRNAIHTLAFVLLLASTIISVASGCLLSSRIGIATEASALRESLETRGIVVDLDSSVAIAHGTVQNKVRILLLIAVMNAMALIGFWRSK